MKLSRISSVLLAIVFTIPASAQVGIYIGGAPPPLRYEQHGAMPGPGYAWVDGYWAPHGHHYAWVAGRWDHPPYEGAYWNHPHYDHYQQGWQLHEGHWDHDDHNNHDREHEHDHDH
jgi:hypothetical protein